MLYQVRSCFSFFAFLQIPQNAPSHHWRLFISSPNPELLPSFTLSMSGSALDKAMLRQALNQTINEALAAASNDDFDMNLLRGLMTRATAPSIPYSFLSSSSQGVGRSSNFQPLMNNSSADDFVLNAIGTERQRLSDMWAAILREHLLENEALRQQQQQYSYLSLLRNAQFRNALPVVAAVASAPGLSSFQAPKTVPSPSQALKTQQDDSERVLSVLGSNLRGKTDPYVDVAALPVKVGQEPQATRGGVAQPFPQKLYSMLQQVKADGKSEIASFHTHGRSFGIHDMEAFVNEILPKYFSKQSKMVSFARQLNLYGFARIHSGADAGGYYHDLFLKGRPELHAYMRRVGASKGTEDRRKRKDRHLAPIQPNFYTMKPVPPRALLD